MGYSNTEINNPEAITPNIKALATSGKLVDRSINQAAAASVILLEQASTWIDSMSIGASIAAIHALAYG